jgi:nitrous oxidase accessory protein NosD
MLLLPNKDILQIAVENSAQAGEGIQVYVAGFACVEAVDEIFGHASFFSQFARRHALAGNGLLFSE